MELKILGEDGKFRDPTPEEKEELKEIEELFASVMHTIEFFKEDALPEHQRSLRFPHLN